MEDLFELITFSLTQKYIKIADFSQRHIFTERNDVEFITFPNLGNSSLRNKIYFINSDAVRKIY